MTAHIDEVIETESNECNPHDCHALLKHNRKLQSRIFFMGLAIAVLSFLLAIFVIGRFTGAGCL